MVHFSSFASVFFSVTGMSIFASFEGLSFLLYVFTHLVLADPCEFAT